MFVDFLDTLHFDKQPAPPPPDVFRVNEIVLAAREHAERRRYVNLRRAADSVISFFWSPQSHENARKNCSERLRFTD
ncbi:MAG: hypothetical protein ABSD27_10330 [Bryobacteraceae bacterium]